MSSTVSTKNAAEQYFGFELERLNSRPVNRNLLLVLTLFLQTASGQTVDSSVLSSQSGGTLLPGIGNYNGIGSQASGGTGRGLVIQPYVNLKTTYTNNVDLSAQNQRSDFITEITPGINITSNGSRIRGYFDYSLHGVNYLHNSSAGSIQRTLNTRFTIEAISNWLFVEANGTVSRQTISPFGLQSVDTTRSNNNVAEVSAYTISPYIRGRIDNFANYQLRYAESIFSSNSDQAASDVRTTDVVGSLSEEYTARRVGWLLQYLSKKADFKQGQNTENVQFLGVASYAVMPQLRISISAGRETNNYLSLNKESYSTYGYGFKWRPTERTQIDAERSHRFFGEGHRLVFNHRMQRLALQYSDVKDVVIERGFDGTTGTTGTLFDILFNQFASIESDPIKRTQLVNNFIQANGLSAGTFINSGFLSSGVILQRRQQLSLSLMGSRNVITILANQTRDSRLNDIAIISDAFANNSLIRQYAYGAQFAHTLALGSAVNLSFLSQKSTGSQAFQKSSLQAYSINYSQQVGLKTVMFLGARRTQYNGGINSYNELAIYGQVAVRF